MSVRESLDAYTALVALVQARFTDEAERDAYLDHLHSLLPKMIEALGAEVQRIITPPVRVAQAPGPAPAAPTPAEPLKADYSYDDWAAFAEQEGRNPADFVRTWFRDFEGGFDASTAAERVDQWAKAKKWIAEQKTKGTRPQVINGGRQGGQGGGRGKENPYGPCPVCGSTNQVRTRFGQRYRCAEHDHWGKVG